MRYILLSAAAVLFLVFTGCKKNPPASPLVPEASAVKSDFFFIEGSYWIMKDSISGRIDSFVVRFNGDSAVSGGPAAFPYDQATMTVWEYNTDHTAPDSQRWDFVSHDSAMYLSWVPEKNPNATVSYNPFLVYSSRNSFLLGSNYDAGADTGIVSSVLANFSLAGQIFATTAVIAHHEHLAAGGSGGSAYGYDDVFYVSPGVGIIKMSINHPQDSVKRVWEVQRGSVLHFLN